VKIKKCQENKTFLEKNTKFQENTKKVIVPGKM